MQNDVLNNHCKENYSKFSSKYLWFEVWEKLIKGSEDPLLNMS